MIKVLLLMGGLFSSDGALTSAGMIGLQSQLERIPDVTVHRYLWGDFARYCKDAQRTPKGTKLVVIGYSGGGERLTVLADPRFCPGVKITLAIAYDPSPSWGMYPIRRNVRRSICYCNTQKMTVLPFFIGSRRIGGGQLTGYNVTKIMIRKQHLAVQFDQALHDRTVREVRRLQ
jgi:hypothetical protein